MTHVPRSRVLRASIASGRRRAASSATCAAESRNIILAGLNDLHRVSDGILWTPHRPSASVPAGERLIAPQRVPCEVFGMAHR